MPTIEVEYTKAKLHKRLFAFIVDFLILILSTALFTTLFNVIATSTKGYKNIISEQDEVMNDSGLFIERVSINDYIDQENELFTINEKKDFISYNLDKFYSNPSFFSIEDSANVIKEYNDRKASAQIDDNNLFILFEGVYIENNVNPQYLIDFYKTEVNEHAVAYLNNSRIYVNASKNIFIIGLIEIIGSLLLSFSIFHVILPLSCFKRGRQTLGMKLYNISLINVKALNVSTKKYWFRCLFTFFVFAILNFVGFLIPTFVNVSMIFFSKTNSGLTNYVFNDYMVDTTNDFIYLDEGERIDKENKLKLVSIDNKN